MFFTDEAESGEKELSQLIQAAGKKMSFCLASIEKRSKKMLESRHGCLHIQAGFQAAETAICG
jgi:hypothetical protein